MIMIKIDDKILKEIGWIKPKKMFAAVSFAHMLREKPGISMFKATQISGNYYEVDKTRLTAWLIKIYQVRDQLGLNKINEEIAALINPSQPRVIPEWEQKMRELEAVVLA